MNVVGALEYLLKFMQPGDCICVEDTAPEGLATPNPVTEEETEDQDVYGTRKLDVLKEFLKRNSDRVKVDRLYTDLFGYVYYDTMHELWIMSTKQLMLSSDLALALKSS